VVKQTMPAGIYIHIPFCRSRCSYCDFATDVFKNEETVERYVNALVKEVENFAPPRHPSQRATPPRQGGEFSESNALAFEQPPEGGTQNAADTIYFGGGTPSLLTPKQLEKILKAVHDKFFIAANSEITMEMNPATVTPETLRDYKSLGINRASFGAQTFDDRELKRLGRKHTAEDVRDTIALLRDAGFANVSFDLIAGLPRQTMADWERNLSEAIKLAPEHISLYLLEVHEGTPLAEQIRSGRQPVPGEDLAAAMYETLLERTAAAGYAQYEISNFSRPGFESRHNLKYWQFDPYYSFGCSAHSFDGVTKRWANERDTAKYVSLIEAGGSAMVEAKTLNGDEVRGEYVFLGLRLNQGLDLSEYSRRFGRDLKEEFSAELDEFRQAGLIEIAHDTIKLTAKGRLYSNEVFSVFA
jgi:oxygen-independent coproporphyrinogen III oxidase